jgi:hypothetical protein
MGEDLVLFRDDQGRPGLLGIHCSHRGADLSYGRLEDGGLRCIYHGWLYDINGRCLEQPGEPAGSTFHEKIQHRAYPCVEAGGMILAYLGAGQPPLLPNYDFFVQPEGHVFATKIFSECNFLQGNEGNLDLLHVSMLHFNGGQEGLGGGANATNRSNGNGAHAPEILAHQGSAPHIERCEAELVDVGLRVCKVRDLGDQQWLRMGTFIMPNSFAFPAGGLNWHVPIDDTHHWKYVLSFDREKAYDMEEKRKSRDTFTPAPSFNPIPNKSNRYLQNREWMDSVAYSGINPRYFAAQDLCVTEGAGEIQDRTRENLPPSDGPLVAGRQLLLGAIQAVAEGRDPQAVVRDPSANHFDLVAYNGYIPKSTDWKECWRQLVAEGRGWVGRPAFVGV